MHRLTVLCSLACNALAAAVVFIVIDVLAGHAPGWRASDVALGACASSGACTRWSEPPFAASGTGRNNVIGIAFAFYLLTDNFLHVDNEIHTS